MLARARRGEREQGVPEVLGRFGFFARGVVYLFIGGIAARVALLSRGHAEGPAGAFQELLEGWHGRAALWVVAAGLLSFVVYRLAHVVRARSSESSPRTSSPRSSRATTGGGRRASRGSASWRMR